MVRNALAERGVVYARVRRGRGVKMQWQVGLLIVILTKVVVGIVMQARNVPNAAIGDATINMSSCKNVSATNLIHGFLARRRCHGCPLGVSILYMLTAASALAVGVG